MEFDDVRAFVTVANVGSVSLAARDLHITQSAVTRRLQRLETSLGTTLLDRRTRPVALTRDGQAAIERCRRLLNDIREVRAAASNKGPLKGEFRVGVAHALTEFTLTEPVGELRRTFPHLVLRLTTGWSREVLERVRSGSLDAAVILLAEGESLPAEVRGTQIAKERLLVVASRQHHHPHHPRPRKIQDLAGAQWILNPEGCAARAGLRRALLQADLDMIVAVEAYNYELQLALVAQNRGLSLVPERILSRSRQRSRLRVLRVAGLEFPLVVWLVCREPLAGFERVVAELARTLSQRL
jgi:DNA-binding transcriptional LysR family regulator